MAVSEELVKIYADAYASGILLCEFEMGGFFMAGAGSVEALEAAERRMGKKIETNLLTVEECIQLGAEPGAWQSTREEACRAAVEAFRKRHPLSDS